MTLLRSRRLLLSFLAALTLVGAACSESESDLSNGALPSSGDVGENADSDEQSQESAIGDDGDVIVTTVPPEGETAVGDDPANGGGSTSATEPDPVVESEDGLSTDLATAEEDDDRPVAAAMPADAAEVCAVVEFGYLGLLEGDTSESVQDRLRDGATAAAAVSDQRYSSAGEELLDAVGTDSATASADALLDVCASDGFERLA